MPPATQMASPGRPRRVERMRRSEAVSTTLQATGSASRVGDERARRPPVPSAARGARRRRGAGRLGSAEGAQPPSTRARVGLDHDRRRGPSCPTASRSEPTQRRSLQSPPLQVGAGATGARGLDPADAVEVLAVADEHGPACRIAGPDRRPRRVRGRERVEGRPPAARVAEGGGRPVTRMDVEHVADPRPGRVRRRVREGRRGLGRRRRRQGGLRGELRVQRHAGAGARPCRQHDCQGACRRDASHDRLLPPKRLESRRAGPRSGTS